MEKRDYSLLRPFDLEAAKAGALHYAWLPYMVGVELVALAGEARQ